MVNNINILYSQTATERLFGKGARLLSIFKKVILIWIAGQRPMFISKKVFHQHFKDRRIEASKSLEVAKCQGYYAVKNPVKDSFYLVSPLENGEYSCTCEDYKNQLNFWGKGRCKHIYAVITKIEAQ
jgi:SWIM zinc finger